MRRYRNPISQIMAFIGSFVHWTYRGLLNWGFEKIGIEVHEKVKMVIAYILTGATLVGLGIWGYLWWWPFK